MRGVVVGHVSSQNGKIPLYIYSLSALVARCGSSVARLWSPLFEVVRLMQQPQLYRFRRVTGLWTQNPMYRLLGELPRSWTHSQANLESAERARFAGVLVQRGLSYLTGSIRGWQKLRRRLSRVVVAQRLQQRVTWTALKATGFFAARTRSVSTAIVSALNAQSRPTAVTTLDRAFFFPVPFTTKGTPAPRSVPAYHNLQRTVTASRGRGTRAAFGGKRCMVGSSLGRTVTRLVSGMLTGGAALRQRRAGMPIYPPRRVRGKRQLGLFTRWALRTQGRQVSVRLAGFLRTRWEGSWGRQAKSLRLSTLNRWNAFIGFRPRGNQESRGLVECRRTPFQVGATQHREPPILERLGGSLYAQSQPLLVEPRLADLLHRFRQPQVRYRPGFMRHWRQHRRIFALHFWAPGTFRQKRLTRYLARLRHVANFAYVRLLRMTLAHVLCVSRLFAFAEYAQVWAYAGSGVCVINGRVSYNPLAQLYRADVVSVGARVPLSFIPTSCLGPVKACRVARFRHEAERSHACATTGFEVDELTLTVCVLSDASWATAGLPQVSTPFTTLKCYNWKYTT